MRHSPLTYAAYSLPWFGLSVRPLHLSITGVEAVLVPLFGHTHGHCGVAIRFEDRWLLHVGDAYYLRAELSTDDHPVSQLAALRADDDGQRRRSLSALCNLHHAHGSDVEMFGYHDFTEFPPGAATAVAAQVSSAV